VTTEEVVGAVNNVDDVGAVGKCDGSHSILPSIMAGSLPIDGMNGPWVKAMAEVAAVE
jgi:hypothetical protein